MNTVEVNSPPRNLVVLGALLFFLFATPRMRAAGNASATLLTWFEVIAAAVRQA